MSLTIRPAAAGDCETIVEFNRLLALESEDLCLDGETLRLGVSAVLADPAKGRYFVAERGGQVVGQVMITPEWTDWRNGWMWWLQSVYVRAEARRLGVFRALFEHVYELARTDGSVRGIRLYVERDNHAAQATYARHGLTLIPFLLFQRAPVD
jgi:GNAT superfamily N-acetyltransferase